MLVLFLFVNCAEYFQVFSKSFADGLVIFLDFAQILFLFTNHFLNFWRDPGKMVLTIQLFQWNKNNNVWIQHPVGYMRFSEICNLSFST